MAERRSSSQSTFYVMFKDLRDREYEVSAALHIRRLSPDHNRLRQRCGTANTLGHDERYLSRTSWAMARDEHRNGIVENALAAPSSVHVR